MSIKVFIILLIAAESISFLFATVLYFQIEKAPFWKCIVFAQCLWLILAFTVVIVLYGLDWLNPMPTK